MSAGFVPSEGSEGRIYSGLSPCLADGHLLPVSPHHLPSLCSSVPKFPFYNDSSHIGLGPVWNRHKDKFTGQVNRIENAEINTHIYGQLMLNRGAKIIQWEKQWSLQQQYLEELDIYMQMNGTGLSYYIQKLTLNGSKT